MTIIQRKTMPIGRRCASSHFRSLPSRLASGAARTGDGLQNGGDDSLLAYATTILQQLGLPRRRYTALSALQLAELSLDVVSRGATRDSGVCSGRFWRPRVTRDTR